MRPLLESLRRLVLAAACAALVACGGGGDGVDSGGTGATAQTLAAGPISGFGSIIVNSVHYTGEAEAEITDDDGNPLDASALTLGSTVTIEGTEPVDTGVRLESRAGTIRVGRLLVGPVQAVDPAAGTLEVLGQAVVVRAGTVFDASLAGGLAALRAGDIVAVSGQLDRSVPQVVATRIEPRPGASVFVLQAIVSAVDPAARTLVAGGLRIDLAGLAAAPSGVAAGDVVRLRLQPQPVGGTWVATSLGDTRVAVEDRAFVEIEGRVSRVVSASAFEVDGIPVDAAAVGAVAGLQPGARVEVAGRAVAGVVIARTVKIEPEDEAGDPSIELEGTLSAVDPVARRFSLRGVTVAWDDTTVFEGGTAADLQDGRPAAAKGRLAEDGSTVLATTVHVER